MNANFMPSGMVCDVGKDTLRQKALAGCCGAPCGAGVGIVTGGFVENTRPGQNVKMVASRAKPAGAALLKIFPFATAYARMLGLPSGKQTIRSTTMAKSQLRGNREAKKPKQPKKPSLPATPFGAVHSRVGNDGAAKKKT
jgi:hypothetical protein